ncbi:dephospho-CoA kinase [bacterium BMS3Abin07]|nr:dephospho-CoA kinase [bacterium BMS3Abin07]GBE31991.1 dephospho-CoA kinase [bacterium BMS3Bbin05]HDO22528.1 dephospho-CoA kinase [Nitrospirota bacterium]HDZ87970.1 dephospho-CoA kinase [Nitrospirota bacterium]
MLVGLTGNFGAGKSTVLKMFGRSGAITADADEIVSGLYKRDDIKRSVINLLGNVRKDNGNIDKDKISKIIFNNKELKGQLEALLHPYVFSEIVSLNKKYPGNTVVVEIPLLFETGYRTKVDVVILVHCRRSTIFGRLRKKGYSDSEIEERLSRQMPDSEKTDHADYIINTDKNIEAIEEEVKMIYNSLKEKKK